ncbi:hypothetical protein [Aliikangiella coralliicola]|uniref:Uncharacterized protein n=1 Tax=Aliikangiella coralliicola TaxID=2592383 RepID=A0A545UG92_9GAMM|nr:hypothetical protein [Aliikangiella coralliicola]TQV88490.1 hypothetical protein FLL46_08170 [Aliikangiella coralliicola]
MNKTIQLIALTIFFSALTFLVLRIILSFDKALAVNYLNVAIIFLAVVLVILLVVVLVHFLYGKWQSYKKQNRRLFIIGDEDCDPEQMINLLFVEGGNLQAQQLPDREKLEAHIIPDFLITDQSPKAKLQLLQLKGSWFALKPKILIVVKVQQLMQMETEQIRKYVFDLNQVAKQLSFWKRKSAISVYVRQTDSIKGYANFIQCNSALSDFSMLHFEIQDTLNSQIDRLRPGLLKAITRFTVERFISLLDFYHYFDVRLSQVNTFLETFAQLQSNQPVNVFIANAEVT